jgi:hypothetical protein
VIGLVINDGYAIAVVPVALVGVIGLVTYIVRELGRVAVVLGRVEERLDAQDRRLDTLERKR